MNDVTHQSPQASTSNDDLKHLKTITGIIYLCQILTFIFAGLPLLIGVVLNYLYRAKVKGTWMESHFDWQIKTAYVTLGLLAIIGLTFATPFGMIILLPTVVWFIYRIVIGWNAWGSKQAVA